MNAATFESPTSDRPEESNWGTEKGGLKHAEAPQKQRQCSQVQCQHPLTPHPHPPTLRTHRRPPLTHTHRPLSPASLSLSPSLCAVKFSSSPLFSTFHLIQTWIWTFSRVHFIQFLAVPLSQFYRLWCKPADAPGPPAETHPPPPSPPTTLLPSCKLAGVGGGEWGEGGRGSAAAAIVGGKNGTEGESSDALTVLLSPW